LRKKQLLLSIAKKTDKNLHYVIPFDEAEITKKPHLPAVTPRCTIEVSMKRLTRATGNGESKLAASKDISPTGSFHFRPQAAKAPKIGRALPEESTTALYRAQEWVR